MIKLIFPCIFTLCTAIAAAQTTPEKECFDRLVGNGEVFIKKGDLGNAINQFWAAYECEYAEGNPVLKSHIDRAVRMLESARDEAIINEAKAQENERLAKEAKEEAIIERDAKEQALAQAKTYGKRAEAMFLSVLSKEKLKEGRPEEALLMAYAGLNIFKDDALPDTWKTFGDVVKEANTHAIFEHPAGIQKLVPIPGQPRLLAMGKTNLFVVDYETKQVRQITAAKNNMVNIALSEKGDKILVWFDNNSAQAWGINGNLIGNLTGHSGEILTVAFSKDGKYGLTTSRDKSAAIWNLENNAATFLSGHAGCIYEAQFSPSGECVLTRSSDGTVKTWRMDGSLMGNIDSALIYAYDAVFENSDNQVITASANGSVIRWDANGNFQSEIHKHIAPAKEIMLLPNGSILSRSLNAILTGNTSATVRTIQHTGKILGIAASSDGELLASWTDRRAIYLYDSNGAILGEVKRLAANCKSVEFSSDGKHILVSLENGDAALMNKKSVILMEWNKENHDAAPACFTSDGSHLLLINADSNAVEICPLPTLVLEDLKKDKVKMERGVELLSSQYDLKYAKDILENVR